MQQIWLWISRLGGDGVLLSITLVIGVWMLARPVTRRAGMFWLLTVLMGLIAVAASKILFLGWGLHPPGLDFTGLSGHGVFAFLVWPVTLIVVWGVRTPMGAWRAAIAGMALAAGVCISRVGVGAHTVSEALLGGLCGAVLVMLFVWYEGKDLRAPHSRRWLVLLLGIGLALGYGNEIRAEGWLVRIAQALSGHAQVHSRQELQDSRQATDKPV